MNKITERRSQAIVLLVRYNQPDERLFAEISSALADLLHRSTGLEKQILYISLALYVNYTLSKIGFSQCQA